MMQKINIDSDYVFSCPFPCVNNSKCDDLDETKAFYSEILGFRVSDSAEGTCTVEKSGGTMIFTSENLWEGRPHCTGTISSFS